MWWWRLASNVTTQCTAVIILVFQMTDFKTPFSKHPNIKHTFKLAMLSNSPVILLGYCQGGSFAGTDCHRSASASCKRYSVLAPLDILLVLGQA